MSLIVLRRCRIAAAVSFLLVFGGLSIAASGARAASPAPNGSLFGSVDLQKVLGGYTKKAGYDQQIQGMSQNLDNEFRIQGNSAMLTKDQQTQLGTLLSKTTPTDADRAQIAALQAQSAKDAQDLATLQQKKDLTDADKVRLDALTKQQAAGGQALQDVAASFQQMVKDQTDKLSAQMTQTIKVAIGAIAQQRGLAVVFDSQVAVYTSNDITDDVIKRINK